VRAVVIGGGLAGLTAAIALAEQGAEVTLLEAKPRLGGATCSFNRDGLIVDTGQHVFLRCCTAYQGLLAKLGVTAHARCSPASTSRCSPRAARPRGCTGPRSPRRCTCCRASPGSLFSQNQNGLRYPSLP